MKKILVATDLSANSKAGLRFAIQLATQNNYKLTFFHVYRILRPTRWSDAVFTSFENTEHEKIKRSLSKFVSALYSSIDALEHAFDCVIQKGISPDKSIRQYAEEGEFALAGLAKIQLQQAFVAAVLDQRIYFHQRRVNDRGEVSIRHLRP